jgi:hypothetical protein
VADLLGHGQHQRAATGAVIACYANQGWQLPEAVPS